MNSKQRHLLSLVITWASSLVLTSILSAADIDRIAPSTAKAKLLKAESGRAVWLVSKMHPETAGHRAPLFTHSFFMQRVDKDEAKLVYQLGDTSVRYQTAIRKDGSLLLESRRYFHYVPVTGPPVIQELGSLDCLALYPDGLLANDWETRDPRQMQPAYFVPFDGTRLHFEDRVCVVESGVKSWARYEGLGYPSEPYRHVDRFVWFANSALYTFDLKNRQRKSVKLETQLHQRSRITAFDGSTALCGVFAFNAMTGKLLGEPNYARRPENVFSVFAVRNQIGYYYSAGTLRATDLSSDEGASVRICDAEPVVPMQDDKGLTIWNGKQWQTIPWLSKLRRP